MAIPRKIKAKFNRLVVNHPRKTGGAMFAGGIWSVAGVGILMTPFDFGISLAAGVATWLTVPDIMSASTNGSDAWDQDSVTTLKYDGEEYKVSKAQAYYINKIQKEIDDLNQKYKTHYNSDPKKAEKIRKRALNKRQKQIDILASDNVVQTSNLDQTPDMDLTIAKPKTRKPKSN